MAQYPNQALVGGMPQPPQEKLGEVLHQTNEQLMRCLNIVNDLSCRLVGPIPDGASKATPATPGTMTQAFDGRSMASRLATDLERLAGII